jgi:hypothetical protein
MTAIGIPARSLLTSRLAFQDRIAGSDCRIGFLNFGFWSTAHSMRRAFFHATVLHAVVTLTWRGGVDDFVQSKNREQKIGRR